MNKPNKKDTINLIFSALLILGYIICTFFFLNFANANAAALAPYISTLVFVVFGLVVFYATRVGEGKAVKRFSLWTLALLVIPSVYIIIAQFVPALPFHNGINTLGGDTVYTYSPVAILAAIALGYGLPYTFFSGYEIADENADTEACEAVEAEEEAEEEICEQYVLCDADTEGALLVVDDLDGAFDAEKEIRLCDTGCTDAKVGSFVVLTQCCEETEECEEAEVPTEA